MSSTKSARAPEGTKALPAHLTAAGNFYRRRPKPSVGPCRAAGCRTSAGYIERAPLYRAGGGLSDEKPVFIRRAAKVISTKSARTPASTEVLPVHLTAPGGFYRCRPKFSAGLGRRRPIERAAGAASGQRATKRAAYRTRSLSSSGGRLSDVVHKVRTGASEHRSFAGALYGGGRLLSTPAQTLGRTMPDDAPIKRATGYRAGARGHQSFAGAPYGAGRLSSTPAQTLGRTMPGDGLSSGRRVHRVDSGPLSGR